MCLNSSAAKKSQSPGCRGTQEPFVGSFWDSRGEKPPPVSLFPTQSRAQSAGSAGGMWRCFQLGGRVGIWSLEQLLAAGDESQSFSSSSPGGEQSSSSPGGLCTEFFSALPSRTSLRSTGKGKVHGGCGSKPWQGLEFSGSRAARASEENQSFLTFRHSPLGRYLEQQM